MNKAEDARYLQLRRFTKGALIAQYRRLGHVWSANPLTRWSKEEIIGSILEIEFREEREAERVAALRRQDYRHAVTHGSFTTTKPFAYRVDRLDYTDQDGQPVLLSIGYWDAKAEELGSVGVAQDRSYDSRIGHSYYGPLRVYVWQQRDQEHYRLPVPDNADMFEFPAHEQLEEHVAKEKRA